MPLGNNRDYKTTERNASLNLRKHQELMNKLIAEGWNREDASREAFIRMRLKQQKEAK